MRISGRKVLVIGLDCLAPKLVFKEYVSALPNIKKILARSVWGEFESTIPPITCPAWASMVTGKTPGELGIYGFRNRADYSYDRLATATSLSIRERSIWDIIGDRGKQSVVMAVPPSYPPKKINGCMLGCFLAPDTGSDYTYPPELKKEIRKNIGEYIIDVRGFRTDDKERLLKEIYRMTDNRFKTAEYLMKNKPWDFFMFVDMGPDRFHHGFWRYCDPSHRKFEKGNKFLGAMKEYYAHLDGKIGELAGRIDDDVVLFIVSDHGAKKIDGCFCVNEWLIRKGYLKLKKYPGKAEKLIPEMIDWDNTYAWGEGGYYCRISFNVKGREPQGIIEEKDRKKFTARIRKDLGAIKYPGSKAPTIIYTPEELYPKAAGCPPDLLVFFGDLSWRSAGKVGFKEIYTYENDTGPDDANHDYKGVFIMRDNLLKTPGRRGDISVYDFAPTVLDRLGFRKPKDMRGRILK